MHFIAIGWVIPYFILQFILQYSPKISQREDFGQLAQLLATNLGKEVINDN